ncbi:hypothetical protein [Candidatus Lokiarchaeum ossiferum]|uniref:hypothetical protein n=1 Tax=Candidatus Lokiarchaeum ossiferum TaxID=2951803 RepID=UPI00352FB234
MAELGILEQYYSKYINQTFTWADARKLLKEPSDLDWDGFFNKIGSYRFNQLKEKKILKAYTPGKNFPAISVTGTDCELNCEHCDKKYLGSMIQAGTESDLIMNLNSKVEKGAIGALISGGCTSTGKVPILKYDSLLKDFKENNPFYLNSHVGLVSQPEAFALKECGIDNVSFDMILDQKSISELFHLQNTVEDYISSYNALLTANLRVTPHILIGARFGKIARELDVLKLLAANNPKLLVFIAMIPPRKEGIMDSRFHLLTPSEISRIIFIAKIFLPQSSFSLGCMRPKGKWSKELERWAIQAGASRMEIPSQATLKWARSEEFLITYFGACCAINEEFEPYAEAFDIRGNLKNPAKLPKKKLNHKT